MPIRRNRQFPSRTSRPNRTWSKSNAVGFASVSVSSKVLIGSFVLSNPGIDETVLRTVGQIGVTSDQTAGTEAQIGAFGMIVVTDLALAAGAASIPGPITDAADDGWFLYVPITQEQVVATAVGIVRSKDYVFDSKAKRRVSEGQGIAIMAENASPSFVFRIAHVLRLLSMIS